MKPTSRLPRLTALALGLALLGASACSLFFERPSVRIADVRVVGVGFSGATAEVDLHVTNPNGYALTSKGLRYQLAFQDAAAEGDDAWATIAEGTSEEVVRVGADDSASVTVAVPFRYGDVGRVVQTFLRTGELRYRLTGDVLFGAPVGDLRIPFDDTGDVEL